MVTRKILGNLLLTTILINCGDNNTADKVAAAKAQQGIASESQAGDPVSITGSPFTTTPGTPDPSLPSGLASDLDQFLQTSGLRSTYDEHLKNKAKLEEQLGKFDSNLNDKAWVEKNIQPAYTAASKTSLILTNKLYETRLSEFQKFDFTGDLKASVGWSDAKVLGRHLNYFDPKMVEFTARRNYFRMYDDGFDQRRFDAGAKVKPSQPVAGLRADTEQYPIYLEVIKRYREAIDQPLTDAALRPAGLDLKDMPREKFTYLDEILYRSTEYKIYHILTGSIGNPGVIDHLSKRGAEILHGLLLHLLTATGKDYGSLYTPSKTLEEGTYLGKDVENLTHWTRYLNELCWGGARNNFRVKINGEITPERILQMKGTKLGEIKQQFESLGHKLNLSTAIVKDSWYYLSRKEDGSYVLNPVEASTGKQILPTTLISLKDHPNFAMFIQQHLESDTISYLKGVPEFAELFDWFKPASTAASLSAGTIKDLSSVSTHAARVASGGSLNLMGLKVNGVSGDKVDLGLPLFVQLNGNLDSNKTMNVMTGSVAYRLGNTVIGAIQGYGNSGPGFGVDGHQLESSVVASHSFGGLFLEGQVGSVAADDVHSSDWTGYRSQLTIGFDTAYVSPFVQVSYRQLDRDGTHTLHETEGYVGLDVDIANLTADTYSIHTRLLAKVGYGRQQWNEGPRDLGFTHGLKGSVEWTAGVNLNSGISFSTNLSVDTLSGSSAGLTVSLDR